MTNNKLTAEFLEKLIASGTYALDEGFIRISDDSELMAMARELQEYRKAATASFYRDGIEAAAKWVDQLRESYDNEYGYHDPDTGTFEFGNDSQREYSDTLVDVAGGIRALHPNTTPQPAPTLEPLDRSAIINKVQAMCSRLPGATFANAAEFALDEAQAELQEYRKAAGEPVGAPDAWLWKKKTGYLTAGINRPMYEPLYSAAIPLYAIPPQPAPAVEAVPVVPDELLTAMEEVLRISERDHEAWHKAKSAIADCRAAMQQPVINRDELPDGLLKAAEFYRQVERDNPPVETGAWKDAVDWLIKEALAAAPQKE